MYETLKCNKVAGIYWLNQPLEIISIRIKLKARESILTLPKFESYDQRSSEKNFHLLNNNKIEEYVFKWQEKIFSKWEFQNYSDIYNCSTEIEKKYHDMVKDLSSEQTKLFTYIDCDNYLPMPIINKKNSSGSTLLNLRKCLRKLNLVEKICGNSNVSSSMRFLFKREDDNCYDEEQWSSMHIVLDNSEYNEDSQILFKDEYIILSLYHNVTHNYLMVTPNVNDIEYNSYHVENLKLEYGVEIDFGGESSMELEDFLNYLMRKWDKKQKKLLSFTMPPLGKKKYFVMFEIISAVDFDMDNMFIEFHIKVPDDIQFTGDCRGRTHTSQSLKTDEKSKWIYGHTVELELECATGIDPLPLKILLEAISVDWWGRHRTEGYCYLLLALNPGHHKEHLTCLRPDELDTIEANSRRYFVGGCHLIKDLDVLSTPQLHKTNFTNISTGSISFRWNIISQSQLAGTLPPLPHPSASGLLRGADAALRRYRKAKATLAAATRSSPTPAGSSGDG